MDNAETILVVILSTFLAIFLLSGIVLTIKIIQIASQIKRITGKAEQVIDKAESVGEFFQQATGRLTFIKVLSNLAHAVMNYDEKSKRKGRDDV